MQFKPYRLLMWASKGTFWLFIGHALVLQALAAETRGQNLENIKVSIHVTDASLKEVFSQIKKQTRLTFIYQQNELDHYETVSFSEEEISLKLLLQILAEQNRLDFKRINNTIWVKRRKSQSRIPVKASADSTFYGKVLDASSGEPLIGATVRIKGTNLGSITDVDGNFRIKAPDDFTQVTIRVSFIGYQPLEISFDESTSHYVEVSLQEDVAALGEVVVIGYGAKDRRELTSSIASISADEIEGLPVSGFDQALTGRLPGVQVTETSGAPGSAMTIMVRGISSITAGNQPLYVVDGVPLSDRLSSAGGKLESYTDVPLNPLNSINMNDIKSIDVLKDAAATAIYGSRGANGVVIIETKQGQRGKPQFSYNTYTGWSTATKKLDMMNAYEFAQLKYDGHNNAYLDYLEDQGLSGSINDPNTVRIEKGAGSDMYQVAPELIPYINDVPGLTDTDWQDAIFRTGQIQSHSLSVAGGVEHISYFISGSYFNQEGIVISSGYEQLSARVNLDVSYEKVRFGINMAPSRSTHDRVKAEGPYWADGVIGSALVSAPIFPVYNQDGSYAYGQHNWEYSDSYVNPVALATETKNNIYHNRLLSNLYMELQPWEPLVLRSSLGVDANGVTRDYYRPKSLPERNLDPSETPGDGKSRAENLLNWIFEQTANLYIELPEDQHLSLLTGTTIQKETQRENYINVRDFPNDLITTINAGTTVTSAGSKETSWALLSYFARAQYDYKNRYFASASIRADGSSRFGKDNRWGYFPSGSVAWVVTSEPWMPVSRVLSFAKLRSSYGVTGNFNIGNFEWISEIDQPNYVLGQGTENEVVGVAPGTLGNTAIRWEKTKTLDLGIELGFIGDLIMVEADYYESLTSDLLLNVPVPEITGFSSGLQNIGEVSNRGLEFAVEFQQQLGEFNIQLGGNFSTNINEVKSLGPEDASIIVRGGSEGTLYITKVGSRIGSYYTYVRDGIFQSDEQIATTPHLPGTRPGDAVIKDLNRDGEITDDDRAITGSYFPDYIFGVNGKVVFKGFDMSVLINSVQGNEIMNLFRRYGYNMEGHQNNFVGALNRWQSVENPGDGETVRANRVQSSQNTLISDWMVEDASYIRVRNITLGYALPDQLLSKIRLNKLRVYVSAQNPFTFTKYIGYNPEVSGKYENNNSLIAGEDYGTYPLSKTYTIGLNVNF